MSFFLQICADSFATKKNKHGDCRDCKEYVVKQKIFVQPAMNCETKTKVIVNLPRVYKKEYNEYTHVEGYFKEKSVKKIEHNSKSKHCIHYKK